MNKKIFITALIALVCLALAFFVSWWFLIPTIILVLLNQREINKGKKK